MKSRVWHHLFASLGHLGDTFALRSGFALILALLVAGCGGEAVVSDTALPPQAPVSLTAELTPGNEVLLRWRAPTPAEGRALVTRYWVYLELAGGRVQTLGDTESLSYRHQGDFGGGGGRYVYHVRALSAAGPSDPSESAYVDVPPGPVSPEPPRSLTAELTPEGHALLRWAAPVPAEGRAPVTDYEVYLESEDGTMLRSLGKTQGALSFRHTGGNNGLTPRTRYVYHVRALSDAGRSVPSGSAYVDVPPGSVPPEAPGSLTAELTPEGHALLRWAAPVPAEGRAPVTDYEVYLERTGGGALQRIGTSAGALSFRHAGLSPSRRYVYHVRALSAAGLSDPSESAYVDVPPGPVPPEAPGSLTAELTPEGHALLRWAAPVPAEGRASVTDYEVYLERTGGGALQRIGTSAGALSFRHAGLSPSRRYVYHVRALSAAGLSDPSESAYVDVPPGPVSPEPPRSLTAELTPEGHALLRWAAPVPAEGRAPVTDYEVYLESEGGTMPRSLGKTQGALSFRYTGGNNGLTPGTRYVYHVRALGTGNRESQPSESAYVDVPQAQPPEAPGSFTAELTANGEALLHWTAPVPAEGRAQVTGYTVYRQPVFGESPTPLSVAGGALYHLDSTVSPGTYVYYVQAQSEAGDSAPSASAFVEVPGVPGLPLVAARLTVRAYDDQRAIPAPDQPNRRQVRIAWIQPLSEPPSAPLSGFLLQSCEIAPDHSSDHCPGGWQSRSVSGGDLAPISPIPLSPPPTIPQALRFVNDLIDCDPEGDGTTRPARMYRIQAQASDPALSSPWSATVGPVCPSATYSPPRRVDALFVEPEPGATFNVCWEVPVNNGSPITGYEIQMSPDEGLPGTEDGWWVLDGHVAPHPHPTRHDDDEAIVECRLYSGLARDDERWFRIRAYNRAGHGDWSAPSHYAHRPDQSVPASSARSAQSPNGLLTVVDARTVEREGAQLGFEVTLDAALSAPVTVDYATEDGSAKAGEDYIGTAGALVFAPGETAKRVEVPVLDDTRDEGEETLTLRLRNAAGALIGHAEATGTIENDDRMPAAWLARFGRTVAAQTVDAMAERFAPAPVSHISVGGASLRLSTLRETRPSDTQAERSRWPAEEAGDARTLAGRALLRSSAFHLATPDAGGPTFSAWGRFATGAFDAVTEGARLDGDVMTGFLGMDVDGGRWLAGAVLSHSEGGGRTPIQERAPRRNAKHADRHLSLRATAPRRARVALGTRRRRPGSAHSQRVGRRCPGDGHRHGDGRTGGAGGVALARAGRRPGPRSAHGRLLDAHELRCAALLARREPRGHAERREPPAGSAGGRTDRLARRRGHAHAVSRGRRAPRWRRRGDRRRH